MSVIHFKKAFNNLKENDIKNFIRLNKEALIGSAIFTANDSLTSRLVRWAESWRCKDKSFIPSHTGSIIEYNNDIYIFDMKPPRASVQLLKDYLLHTKDDYAIVFRDFYINTQMFSINVAYHIGEFYPYLSALRSVLTKRQTKWVRHCSELHLRELQKQGLFKDVNSEITPDELYHLLGEV